MASALAKVASSPIVIVLLIHLSLVMFFMARYRVRLILQRRYEKAFLDHADELILRERERTNQPLLIIPLTFRRQGAEDLFALCLASRSTLKPGYKSYRDHLRENPPSVEENLIRLRRVKDPRNRDGFLHSQMIRCDSGHALVESGDGRTAYLLKRENDELRRNRIPTFNIDSKFRYRQEQETAERPRDHRYRQEQETAERPRDQGIELMPMPSVTTDQPSTSRSYNLPPLPV